MSILEELQKIEHKHGILRPEDVVDYAKDEKTALHTQFNWDDTDAARLYRLWQARKIITAQVTIMGRENIPIQAFVSLSTDQRNDRGGYRPLITVLSNQELHDQLLEDALADAILFKNKYHHLQELAKVFEAITEIEQSRKRKPER